MNYYCLKLGAKNCEADVRLRQKPPTAAVYFDDLSAADYAKGQGNGQARLFQEVSRRGNRSATVMVVIYNAKIFFLEPTSDVRFGKGEEKNGFRLTAKEMDVKIMREAFCKNVPPVLAGITNSQYHGRRTFTQVSHWGNKKAIDHVLRRVGEARKVGEEHWDFAKQGPSQLLECLGSTEFETLIGKLFEAKGCHVPAYLGGTLKEIDLFAHNDSKIPIVIDPIIIPAGGRISIQVKTWADGGCLDNVDYFIAFDAGVSSKTFNAEWVLARVKECPSVLQWLRRSVNWLPSDFLQKFGL